ncbi:helix-turn-helix domain-containing protein [Deinococcus sp. SDU3-2]|uniref:Helix-turn-helix domain-containing protein n=1 Tax=Deinococcus terrestris TaxID=2651870 RepID=A0A7X1TS27_9DEIO|nr:helix-turn-helix domain-containing protein [Deinococcus terrestris]
MDTQFIQIGEACKVLGISKPTLYRLISQGILPAVRTGDKFRLNRADVEKLSETGWRWADAEAQ